VSVQTGRGRNFLEHVPPPVYFGVCLLAGWSLDRSWRWTLGLDDLFLRLMLGGALLALAAALGLWSLILFRRARTTPLPFGTPKALLTSGPFRISRNPLYVALGLALAAFGALLDNGWVLAFLPLLLLALDRCIVPGEEIRLRELFDEVYLAYCGRVRRWL